MGYTPPSVGPAGLEVSNYTDILNDNLEGYLNIFGVNSYIAPDSAAYQLISIFSLKIADCNLGLQLAYNQSAPGTAVGAGLDRSVKMNGLARKGFTFSTAPLHVVGTAGKVITNGFAQDQNQNLWALPSPTTIGGGGGVDVTGTCTTPGAIAAPVGDISIISTPQAGWSSVTNTVAATPGDPVEADSQLRARQGISVALPSQTRLQSTIASVEAIAGVTRVAPGIPTPGGPGSSIENPTSVTDSWGNPPHSISMVVEGATDAEVAQAIYGARGIGCFTNGTTTVPVTDPNSGYTMDISFFRPTYDQVAVLVIVTPLAGFTSAVALAIQAGIVAYLNSLAIGEAVVYSELYGAALTARPNPDQPLFSITTLKSGLEAASTTADTTITANMIVVASATGIANGQLIADETNPGTFPPNTTVTGISGTTITLSANATASNTGDAVKFFDLGTSDLDIDFNAAAQGVAPNVQVVS